MDFLDYITGKALYLIPVLYILGIFLKSTPKISDWMIPWFLVGFGIAGACAVIGFSADGVLQGILAAGAAVLGNQLYKQTLNK